MFAKNMIICVVVVAGLVVVLGGWQAASCRDEKPREEMMSRRGMLGAEGKADRAKIEEMKEQIEKLLGKAKDAEQEARRLRAEAAELERAVRREVGPIERRELAGGLRVQLAELEQRLDRAECEGRGDEADDLRGKIKRIREQMKAQQGSPVDVGPGEAKEKVVQLRRKAQDAKERGDMEQAERVWAETNGLEQKMNQERERQEAPEHVGQMERELAEIRRAAEIAGREGRREDAGELHKKAQRLALEIEKTAGEAKRRGIEKEVGHLREMAQAAKRAGDQAKAEMMMREAEKMESNLRDKADNERQRREIMEMRYLVEEMRGEVGRLRGEVEELRRGLHVGGR